MKYLKSGFLMFGGMFSLVLAGLSIIGGLVLPFVSGNWYWALVLLAAPLLIALYSWCYETDIRMSHHA